MVTIHGTRYKVNEDEFEVLNKPELYPLKIRRSVSSLDKEIAVINKIRDIAPNFYVWGWDHDGYVLKNLMTFFENVSIIQDVINLTTTIEGSILRVSPNINLDIENLTGIKFIVSDSLNVKGVFPYTMYEIYSHRFLYVHNTVIDKFISLNMHRGDKITYDNLIRILFMVKDAGDIFYEVLTKNIVHADKISILDTGSTDNTMEIIKRVKEENPYFRIDLYQEPFINFRDSRNRLFDLVDEEDMDNVGYAFNIVLDDTYILDGNIRDFLTIARGDDEADSFSLYIKDTDMIYSSNRITKPRLGLRYKYKIHEIIESNNNMLIPIDKAWINNLTSSYMNKRTTNRKTQDLAWLFEELEENPKDPRTLYYIAETYLCMNNYQKAYEWYTKRAFFHNEGYKEEKYDAFYKRAVMADINLGISWEKCHQMYLEAFEFEPLRPESLFMIGKHYADLNENSKAFFYIKNAFDIFQTPSIYNMNVKTEMYTFHIPRYLLPLCYMFNDYFTGEKVARVLTKYYPNDSVGNYWLSVFYLLNQNKDHRLANTTKKKLDGVSILFICPGGWEEWDGETLRTRGLGGSETCVVKYAEEIAKKDGYNMFVACNCDKTRMYNNVMYIQIFSDFHKFISEHEIDICFVHRYPEYLPVVYMNNIPTYLFLHDLVKDIITKNKYFKGILTLSEWHKEHVIKNFPEFKDITHVISYGIDVNDYICNVHDKQDNSFIYPSFPNRGLYWLLKIFPEITKRYPNAVLNIFCRFDLDYVKKGAELEISEIERMISEQDNVTNHGWVNENVLKKFWKNSKYWFYPCHFKETCCRVGMEAAASKTLAITNDLAALQNTVGDRGIVIPGDPRTEDEWCSEALQRVLKILDGDENTAELLNRNFEWISEKTYLNVVNDFIGRFCV